MQSVHAWFGSLLDTRPYGRGGLLPAVPVMGAFVAVAVAMGGVLAMGGEDALTLCVSILILAFALLDYRSGVILLMLALPLSSSTLFPHAIGGITGLNPLNLLLLGTIAGCVIQRARRASVDMPLVPRRLLWSYLVPIAIAGFMGAQHVDDIPSRFMTEDLLQFYNAPTYLRDVLLRPLWLVIAALLIARAVCDSRQPDTFLAPFLLTVCTMSAVAIGYVVLSGASLADLSGTRAREFFSPIGIHANDLGRLYGFAYAIFLFTLAETTDRPLRAILLASMLLLIVALTLTFSRGAFFGFGVANLLFLLSRRNPAIILLGVLLAVLLVFAAPGAVIDRVTMGWGSDVNTISAGRVDHIWLPLLPEILNSPIIGHGLGSIMWSEAMHAEAILFVTHPHNAYLQAALDMGVVGLGLLCAYFFQVWRGFRRLAADPAMSPTMRGFFAGAAAGLISLMLAAFSGGSLVPANEQLFLWLVIGLMYGYQRRLEK